jgi:hypothetical protein
MGVLSPRIANAPCLRSPLRECEQLTSRSTFISCGALRVCQHPESLNISFTAMDRDPKGWADTKAISGGPFGAFRSVPVPAGNWTQ